MTSQRIQELFKKMERNKSLVLRTFANVQPEGWDQAVHEKPGAWTLRDLLAHFVSSERMLLKLSKDISGGGRGAPQGFDYDAFNIKEQELYRAYAPEELLRLFGEARDSTLAWIGSLVEGALDRKGNHPALGEVTLEDILSTIHGHILLHIRELP
ncbi:MAG: DinB family protein [Anaerolineales bacterium]|nr:DinB family protein [Anaerolineales bacterium]